MERYDDPGIESVADDSHLTPASSGRADAGLVAEEGSDFRSSLRVVGSHETSQTGSPPQWWDALPDMACTLPLTEPETGPLFALIAIAHRPSDREPALLAGVRSGIASRLAGRRPLTVLRPDQVEISFIVSGTNETDLVHEFARHLGELPGLVDAPQVRFVQLEPVILP